MFGENYIDPKEKKPKAPASVQSKQEFADNSNSKSYFTVVVAVVLGFVLIGSIVQGAGAAVHTGAGPKAVVFLFEGLPAGAFEELKDSRAPNIANLLKHGQWASCQDPAASSCCTAQNGPQHQAAPGFLSVLTGVDPEKHGVLNNSFDFLRKYDYQSYPTVLTRMREAGLATAAVGNSHLITAIGDNACNAYGVLDFECGDALLNTRCLATSSCNLNSRISLATTSSGSEQFDVVEDAKKLIAAGNDAVFIHLNSLEAVARRSGAHSEAYAAQMYITDSIVGNILSEIQKLAGGHSLENWLVLGVSDHGDATLSTEIDQVTLFAAAMGPTGKLPLKAPVIPVQQVDVAVTLAAWFGVSTKGMDGQRQFVCGNGQYAANCTEN